MPATKSPAIGARRWIIPAAAILFVFAGAASAQVVTVPPNPQIGSSNPVTAASPVSRPDTKPCVVQLFSNLAFADFTPKTFTYTPPSRCRGPWAKVVFTADFTVTKGRQYDRTAAFYLGHANIYYGTTAEPRSSLSPSWHVERDVTDLSAIFKSGQTGEANIGNFVGVSGGVTYNGIIYSSAALEFYPADWRNPPAQAPDVVVPVNGTGGDAGTLNTTTDQITQILNLPTNVERVYLDVIAQSQSNDEFWYLCVPSNEASNLITCGNTTTTRNGWFVNTNQWHFAYPLNIKYSFLTNPDGTYTQITSVNQKDLARNSQHANGFKFLESDLQNQVDSTDTLYFDSNFNVTGNSGASTKATYRYRNSSGKCYSRTLTAADNKLTSANEGRGCTNHSW